MTTKRLGNVTSSDLNGRSLVLLNDSDLPGGELGRRLVEYVQNGGGLLVALGDRSAPRERPAYAAELLPPTADAPIDRSDVRGGTLGYIDRSHPIFELFSAPRSGDFSTPRFFRSRSITPAPGDEQVARFDDGHIALLERKVGRGRVLVFASSFDGIWNDLPLQPVFLPVAHQLAKYVAAYADERPWNVVGNVANLPAIFRDSTGPGDAASKAEVLQTVGALAARVREALGDTVAPAASDAFTAANLEAVRAYARGQEFFAAGKPAEAIPAFLEAARIYPDFGRAYSRAATALLNLGQREQADAYYRKALEKIDRMTDREKFRIKFSSNEGWRITLTILRPARWRSTISLRTFGASQWSMTTAKSASL